MDYSCYNDDNQEGLVIGGVNEYTNFQESGDENNQLCSVLYPLLKFLPFQVSKTKRNREQVNCNLFAFLFVSADTSTIVPASSPSTIIAADLPGEVETIPTNNQIARESSSCEPFAPASCSVGSCNNPTRNQLWKKVCWDTWFGHRLTLPSPPPSIFLSNRFSISEEDDEEVNHDQNDIRNKSYTSYLDIMVSTSNSTNDATKIGTPTTFPHSEAPAANSESKTEAFNNTNGTASTSHHHRHHSMVSTFAPPPSSTIESVAGYISGQYTCVYEGVNGVLYAGEKALYFVGTYFLFEKKMKLPWEIIRQVVQLDHGVQILTKKDNMHTFSALQQPSRVWPVLVSLHNDALLDRPRGAVDFADGTASAADQGLSSTSILSRRSIQRSNSDPAALFSSMTAVDCDEDYNGNDLKEEEQYKDVKEMNVNNGVNQKPSSGPLPSNTEAVSAATSKLSIFPVAGLSADDVKEKLGEVKIQPIACTYDKIRGTFFGGWKGLYFYGKRFFWDIRKLYFPFGALKQIQIVPDRQGISITFKNGQSFLLEKMENADKVWASLIALHNEILFSRHDNHQQQLSQSSSLNNIFHQSTNVARSSLVRTNSDPNLSVLRLNLPSHEDDGEKSNDTNNSSPSKSSTMDTRTATRTPASCPAKTTSKRVRTPSSSAGNTLQDSTEKEWVECVSKKSQFRNLVVKDLLIKCSLDEFIRRFLANNASHSIEKFLESRGDSSLSTSEWETTSSTLMNNGRPTRQRRVIHYKHPVNAPLAPPKAGARKEQTLTRYGSRGLCLETRTIVDDVPMADCFHVDDRIRVEQQQPNNQTSTSVVVSMEFEITFIKSTMFKGIIEKTTRSEFTDFFKQMGSFLGKALGDEAAPVENVISEPEPTIPHRSIFSVLRGGETAKILSGLSATIHPFLFLFVVLLQWYIVLELIAIKGTLLQVQMEQQRQHQILPPEILKLLNSLSSSVSDDRDVFSTKE